MIRQLKADLQYAWSKKSILWMLLLFAAAAALTFFFSYQNADIAAFKYEKSVEFEQSQGRQMDSGIQKGYQILEDGTIVNPIAYDYEKLGSALYSLSPRYAFSLYCESSMIFFPILASFFGLSWVSADLKHRTLRHRVLRAGKINSFLSKQISGLIVLLAAFALTVPLVFAIQAGFRSLFLQSFSLNVSDFQYTSKIAVSYWKQALLAAAVMLFYYEFGYTFGNLLRGNPISIVVVCVYVLFFPVMFAYDIANIFNNIARRVFEFVGAFTLEKVIDVSIPYGALELAGLFALMILCNIFIAKKRSAYA